MIERLKLLKEMVSENVARDLSPNERLIEEKINEMVAVVNANKSHTHVEHVVFGNSQYPGLSKYGPQCKE